MDTCLFAVKGSEKLGEALAAELGLPLAAHEEREFEDGEHKIRPLVDVREKDVYVIHSLYSEPGRSVNDKLCRLLFFLGALRDAWAGRVTALIPYLCYARKDRRSKPRDPVATRSLARMLEAVGTDRVVTMDVHNLAAFENAHRVPTANLEARPLFVEHFAALEGPLAVVSPDSGGVKRADHFRTALEERVRREIDKGFVEKLRSEGRVWGHTLVGEVEGRTVILLDDLIASGGTMVRAAEACLEQGAAKVYAAATHAVFTANQLLESPAVEQVVVADTIPPRTASDKLVVLPTARLWADLVQGGSTG